MDNNQNFVNFKGEVRKIMDKAETDYESLGIKDFTYSLVSLIWFEICLKNPSEIDENDLEDYAEEISQSLEIMNPELKTDIELVENLLKLVNSYKN